MTDIDRILALHRPDLAGKVPDLTDRFAKTGGRMRLWPVQNLALFSTYHAGGLLGLIGVGEGKTLYFFLAPWVLRSEAPVLLVPGSLREKTAREWEEYSSHFHLPSSLHPGAPVPRLRSYEELSNKPGLLASLAPDAIFLDEAHHCSLKEPASNRFRRLRAYLVKHPDTRLVACSGSLTTRSILDYAHLCVWALKERSPLPLDPGLLRSWSAVIDPEGRPSPQDRMALGRVCDFFGVSDPEQAYKENLSTALGVVVWAPPITGFSLHAHLLPVKYDAQIRGALKELQDYWRTPAGEELSTSLEYSEVMRQLRLGFFHLWLWEGEPDWDWLTSRSAWAKATRAIVALDPPEFMDSPGQLGKFCEYVLVGDGGTPTQRLEQVESWMAGRGAGSVLIGRFRVALDAWITWRHQKTKPPPPVGIGWVSTVVVDQVVAWGQRQRRHPLVWCAHRAFAEKVAAKSGWAYYGGGKKASKDLLSARNPHPAVVSMRAHREGKNLQHLWSNNLFVEAGSDAKALEQAMGRTAREGQRGRRVDNTFLSGALFDPDLHLARRRAAFIQQTTGVRQRLLRAVWSDPAFVTPPEPDSELPREVPADFPGENP